MEVFKFNCILQLVDINNIDNIYYQYLYIYIFTFRSITIRIIFNMCALWKTFQFFTVYLAKCILLCYIFRNYTKSYFFQFSLNISDDPKEGHSNQIERAEIAQLVRSRMTSLGESFLYNM